jgi:hypothetical protein
MFCREQAARAITHLADIHAQGATLVAIGNGTALMAADFVRQFNIPYPVYTDPSRKLYALAGMHRRFGIGLAAVGAMVRALKDGHRQGAVAGDPWQQGGVLVVAPGGKVLFAHADEGAGDHAAWPDVLAAVRSAAH